MGGGLPAVIELSFDPTLHLGDLAIRWQALAVAAGVLLALLVAARLASVRPRDGAAGRSLRLDDLLYLTVAILPGAIVGGRLVSGLAYLDAYAAQPATLLDPARGGFSLLGAVLGGALSATYIAGLLEGTASRWAAVAAVPMLIAIGAGKAGQFVGGGGQGSFTDVPWAVSFSGVGPWQSVAATVPAHPVALYEAIWAFAGIPFVLWAGRGGAVREGWRPFVIALCWFLAGRALLGTFWRDDRVVGPLGAEQAMAAVSIALVVVLVLIRRALPRRTESPALP
jgi:prolipoprotein diacylglyceryltransferase